MANEVHTPPSATEPNLTVLVSGIISDAQELFKQQVALIRAEIRSDLQKTVQAVGALIGGAVAMVLAMLFLCFTLVHLLHWLTSPPGYDPASLPLWSCYLIVGGTFGLAGGVLVYLGVRKFESFNPLPDQSVEALRENLQWRTTSNPR